MPACRRLAIRSRTDGDADFSASMLRAWFCATRIRDDADVGKVCTRYPNTMIVTLETIFGLFAVLLIAALLLATGLWVLIPVLLAGVLVWIGFALSGPGMH
jgi:hypothetical protein